MRKLNVFGTGMSILLALSSGLLVGCVDEPKANKPKAAAKAPKGLVVDAPPADMKKLGTELGDKVTLLGYKLDVPKGKLKAGDKVSYTLYWKLNKPLDSKGWQLYSHVFDGGKKRLLNIDKVGDLRRSKTTPNKWKVGKVYVDRQHFTIPKNVTGDALKVVTGLWREKQSLKVVKGAKYRKGALALTIPLNGAPLEAQWTPPKLRADKLGVGTRILVDGKLTEAAWASAPQTGAFVNVQTGKPDPKQAVQGHAKLLWDDRALYVAFEVTDKDVVGGFKKSELDAPLWTKDAVQLMLDPEGNGDNRDYYAVLVGPQNAVFDSRFDTYHEPKPADVGPFGHQEWASRLTSAVIVNGTLDKPGDEDKGYTVELSIPWTSFDKVKNKKPAVGDTWRVNFYAIQDTVAVGWSPIMNKGNLHKASQFGQILFAEKGWSPVAAGPVPTTGVTSVTSALNAAPSAAAPRPAVPATTVAPKPIAPKPSVPAVPATPKAPTTPVAPKPAAP